MTSSSDIDYSQFCAGCALPSVVRCGNCWKGGKGKNVGYCSAAHQKMMWISHKPYCGGDESGEPVVFFQTPLSESEFTQFIAHIATPEFDAAEFLDNFFLGTRQMIKNVMSARLPKVLPFQLWTEYNLRSETGQDFEVHHDKFMIRHVMTMSADFSNQPLLLPHTLHYLYGLATPPPRSQVSAVWRKATSDYYFAMLNYETVFTNGKEEDPVVETAAAYTIMWQRVRIAVRVMESNGFEQFVPEIFEVHDSFLAEQIG